MLALPFCTQHPQYYDRINQGDDISGIVEAVGKDVLDVRPGDQVAAFHRMGKPHGACRICHCSGQHHLPSPVEHLFRRGRNSPACIDEGSRGLVPASAATIALEARSSGSDLSGPDLWWCFSRWIVRLEAGEIEQPQSHYHCCNQQID
jgi:hypothetical protein